MTVESAIYRGMVHHVRRAPTEHRFRYRVYMAYLDLDEIEAQFAKRWLWSHESWNVLSFRRDDYLGGGSDPAKPLRAAVLDEVEAQTGARPTGPIRMLTQLRCFGFVFNPVTFYYCFEEGEPGAEPLAAIVAEITNTPWLERHRYVLQSTDGTHVERAFDKEFHISPFMAMDQRYEWEFSRPDERLRVHMKNVEHGDRVFDAAMDLERRPFTGAECAKALARHPFMTAKVVFGIYFQALRLKLKRTPFHSHPATAAGPEVS